MKKKNRLFFWRWYLIYICFIVVCVDMFLFHQFRTRMFADELIGKPFNELRRKVGLLVNEQTSSYVHFPLHKAEGVTRVGCFGDSFTYGDEVAKGFDYPSQLQEVFLENGRQDVEVLNFGMSWHGFHQTYIVWEMEGLQAELDYVLLGPEGFQHTRDSTFNHGLPETLAYIDRLNQYGITDINAKPFYKSYLHSRFILKGEGTVQRIDPIGMTQIEIMRNYYKFIPRLIYARYDLQPPFFIRAAALLLFPGRSFKINPFYYHSHPDEEMNSIYRILLSHMAETSKNVFLGHYDESVVALGKSLDNTTLKAETLIQPKQFPYLMKGGHNSPCGNRLLAQQYYALLTDDAFAELSMFETHAIPETPVQVDGKEKQTLEELKRLYIEVDDQPLGGFYFTRSHGRKSTSLIGIPYEQKSMLDIPYLPCDIELTEGMPVTLTVTRRGKRYAFECGIVTLIDPSVTIGAIIFDSKECTVSLDNLTGRRVFDFAFSVLFNNDFILKRGDAVSLDVAHTVLMEGTVGRKHDTITLVPESKECVLIRAFPDVLVDIDALPDTGYVYIVLIDREGVSRRIPCAIWSKSRQLVSGKH